MSQCHLDHSQEDVLKKLHSQAEFLPADLYNSFVKFVNAEQRQAVLNEAFHLLKKYDLSTDEEKQARNLKMKELLEY